MATVPRTEIEIGAVCPPAFVAAGGQCAEHQSVTVLFQWVCPGAEGVNSNICPGSGFAVNLSVNGKLAFSADGIPINGNSPLVPAAPCPRDYLIGSAISDQPNFGGVIGNAVIRGPNLGVGPDAGLSTAVSVMIQAGITITGVKIGDVKYEESGFRSFRESATTHRPHWENASLVALSAAARPSGLRQSGAVR